MKTARYIFVAFAAIGLLASVLLVAGPGKGGDKAYEFHPRSRDKIYEVHPEIILPEYRTDAGYSIDAYQRLMDRYMDITEKNLVSFRGNMRNVFRKLDSIDSKLDELSQRMTAIETALGIKQPAVQETDAIQEPKAGKKFPDNQIKTNTESN